VWAERWSPDLRQGDVIGEILFPQLGKTFDVLGSSRSLIPEAEPQIQQVVLPATPQLLVIVSHDCEFNEGKRNKVLVARVQGVPGNLSGEQREHLRRSNDIATLADEDIAGVDSFLLQPIPSVTEQERVVNFATITPLPMGLREELRSQKRAEMAHGERLLFRRKLAWFLGGRGDDDISDDERIDPYPPEQPEAHAR
jgi:hypothetical protein